MAAASLQKISRLSPKLRNSIIRLSEKGYSNILIRKTLEETNNVAVTRKTIRLCINRYRETGSIKDRPRRQTGKNLKITPGVRKIIQSLLSKNNELTSVDICLRLKTDFNLIVSRSTVNRVRVELGWVAKRLQYCQLISHKNKRARVQWCLDALSRNDAFTDVIFTDETTVEMNSNGRLFFHNTKCGDIQKASTKKQKPKHAYKVHVWGGISYRGRTALCIFSGIMDSVIYQGILEKNFIPFANRAFPNGYRLYQNNDSKHKSASTRSWMEDHGVLDQVIETPASSPDINCIENVWASLKYHLQTVVKPKKKDELVCGIRDFWNSLTIEQCRKYIDHIHKVIPVVILNDGGPTGY